MIVMKFGGTSVANFEAITRAIFIVGGRLDKKPVVVVSALSKVTDLLYRISDAAAAGNVNEAKNLMDELRSRHVNLASDLLEQSPALKESAVNRVNAICDSLESLVNAVCAVKELSDRNKAIIISNGELLSSTIICFVMNAKGIRTNFIDARQMMITSDEYLKGEPVVNEITARVPAIIEEAYKGMDAVITQGFIGSNLSGEQTVLGRGGSDYSASLIGMAIDAERIEIWTDVDGVRSADPRTVENTKYLEKISFEEAAEMAPFRSQGASPSDHRACCKEEHSDLCAQLDESFRQGHSDPSQRAYRGRCEVGFIQGEHPRDQYLLDEDDQYFRLPSPRIRNLQRKQGIGRPYQYIGSEYLSYSRCFGEDRQGRGAAF